MVKEDSEDLFTIDTSIKSVIEKQNVIKSRLNILNKNQNYQTKGAQISPNMRDNRYKLHKNSPSAGTTALYKDNPSNIQNAIIGQYMKQLDDRLSIPKFDLTFSSSK
jgi:hypothetical protein